MGRQWPSDLEGPGVLGGLLWLARGGRNLQIPAQTDPGQRSPGSVHCAAESNELLEVENGAAPGDRRRIDFHADILLDPLGGTPGGLIGAGLVLTDGHGLPTAVVAERFVADESRHGADEGLHVLVPLGQLIEQLRCALLGIASDGYIHGAFSSAALAASVASLRLVSYFGRLPQFLEIIC